MTKCFANIIIPFVASDLGLYCVLSTPFRVFSLQRVDIQGGHKLTLISSSLGVIICTTSVLRPSKMSFTLKGKNWLSVSKFSQ